MSLNENLEVAADRFLDVGHVFIAARKRAGYASSEEAMRLLQN